MSNFYKELLGVERVIIVDKNIIITGNLIDSNDEKHNCDIMGCSSVEHVILRGHFDLLNEGYDDDIQLRDLE